jgi:hypothetical protein
VEELLRKEVQAALTARELSRPEEREATAARLSAARKHLAEFLLQEQRATEDNLREALERAKTEHEAAREEVRLTTQLRKDLGSGNPDGSFAIIQANNAHVQAHRKHQAALKAFNDFVLDRKLPADIA